MPIGGNVTFSDTYKHTQTWYIRYLRGMKQIKRGRRKTVPKAIVVLFTRPWTL